MHLCAFDTTYYITSDVSNTISLNIERTQTLFLNIERVHLLVIEHEDLIIGIE